MKTKLPTQREYILNLDCNFKPEKASYSYTSAKLTFCHLTLSNSMGFTYSKQPPKCVLLSKYAWLWQHWSAKKTCLFQSKIGVTQIIESPAH